MPGNHHHRHRLNRKGHKKQKQKIPNKPKSPNDDNQLNNENPLHQQNEIVDLNITYDTPTNKTITANESKILQELYGDNDTSKYNLHHQSNNASSIALKKPQTQCQITITANQSDQKVKNKRHKPKYMNYHKDEVSSVDEKKYKSCKSMSHNSKTPNMHLIFTTRSSFDNKNQLDVSPSITSTKQQKKNKTNDLMVKTPNDSNSRMYAIYTPYSKKRPLNNSPSDQSTIAEDELASTNVTKSFTSSWTITSQAKRSRRAGHIAAPDINICCTPKRLFHDQQPPTSTPITYTDPPSKNQIVSDGGGDPHQRLIPPSAVTASVISQTFEKCNKLTFTNISTHSITEYNEQVKITMSLNYSNNGQKSQQMVPDDFETKCSRRFSWFNSITSSFHNFLTNVKKLLIQDWVSNMLRSSYNNVLVMNAMMDFVIKKWATITLKRQSSNLGSSSHQQINTNNTTHTHHKHMTAAIGQHADCYAQIQIMQRTIRDLTAIAEEQNKKIENLTNEVMQLKLKSTTATFNGLMFGSGSGSCNNCGLTGTSSMIPAPPCAPPIPPPPPPPLPPFSLIKPMNNTLFREKKTGSRQLQQRSSSIGTDRPAITLEDILSVKLKKTKPAKQNAEPEPKSNNVNVLSKTKLKQVRLRTKSRVRSRGASPAQQFFDNCKSGTNSLLELLENSGRNIQVQNLITTNQNHSSVN
ncbi:uncharacterized protein LOC123300115 isoform X2 [Chrysoperla carnea]|nr:uncharacterized protein LOC123300115 isoform X2 [Chrysoperla carnea]XP_044738533.1 uncharacterized protein LOC123300115 isoform X2 [Chrysoperla carnea]XP_044738534.1 uncharacterized protein LOC123300115 isoform X2 [Chrysoperla carnea]XP_044738535.1 uncharacterized protein LOC123300115 isoform X2 [Chrysoperla carnea]